MNRRNFDAAIAQFNAASKDGLQMKSVIISDPRGYLKKDFIEHPTPTDLRSISKLVVSLALGVAIESGVQLRGEPLSLDTRIAPFFADFVVSKAGDEKKFAEEIRLRHLITNTIGHRNGFLFRADVGGRDPNSLLDYIFAQPLEYPPGTHFSYSNVGWYLLSAIVRDELGVPLSQWVEGMLLRRLGILNFDWVKYGLYEAGATGLSMANEDLHKIGQLLLQGGRFGEERIVPESWIKAACSPVIAASSGYDPSSPLQASGYGYGIWVCEDGTLYCDGSGGQFLIVIPAKSRVITALTESGDTLRVSTCLRPVL
ncbi:serine hydrolase [Actinoplanes sp. NPDC049596]|uniref:serine hydrolase domain-containing protein n=1 Tax=unclassified Actinoplanes TaxID=2626549 RepID=UPI0034361452